jgi:hypothetical protein
MLRSRPAGFGDSVYCVPQRCTRVSPWYEKTQRAREGETESILVTLEGGVDLHLAFRIVDLDDVGVLLVAAGQWTRDALPAQVAQPGLDGMLGVGHFVDVGPDVADGVGHRVEDGGHLTVAGDHLGERNFGRGTVVEQAGAIVRAHRCLPVLR